ncbi:uncharacterized protein PAC_15357 [Phialocephala subalpina]|uniref:SET domain-containing protein n=1 Tax=Phialocephala subalpina TaxID=576137 RepID=A0A1L7XKI9_9HELO|nr:uncharacterized protein PAC_15357 [Phialocephala subalpina]
MAPANQRHTIFLTPEEDRRLRKTFKDRLQKCRDLTGQPRVPTDPKTLSSQVIQADLLSDMGQTGRSDAVVAFPVGNPYPPCIVSLQDLQPIELADLLVDTHHRGRMLTVRRVSPVVKLQAYSWTVVQKIPSGETERLEMSLHKSKHGHDILESGNIFQIKEPYFTISDQGEPTLRIDHPSDIAIRKDTIPTERPFEVGDSTATIPDTQTPALPTKTPKEWKEEGNAALKQKDLLLAHSNYTQGIQLVTTDGTPKEDSTFDLFRNRAHVNLALNRLDEAKADALSALTNLGDDRHKELDSKSYSRAGIAAYNLGSFQEAKQFFEEQLKLSPNDKEATIRLKQAEKRLKEQETGSYDLKKIKASLLMGHRPVDAATFTRNVKIKDSPGRGRGLYVTCAIKAGDIVMAEKPFCVVWGHEAQALTAMTYDTRHDRIRVFPAGLAKSIVQKLSDNPSQVEKIMDLYGDYRGLDKQLIIRDSGPVIDTFQIHDIVARNAFGPGPAYTGRHQGEQGDSNASAGLWVMAAYINHSCIPNAKLEYIGDLMLIRATRSISANEEIFHSYEGSNDFDARSAALMNTWGFTCDCKLCEAEKADSPDVRKKRGELEKEADAFVQGETASGARRMVILKAKRLEKSIQETYDGERYKGLPRTALVSIQKWIAEASTR